MVVDDHPRVRAGLAALLSALGRIDTAANGEAALAHLQTHPVQVLIVDLHMPRMDGGELIRRYRRQGGMGATVLFSADPALDEIASELRTDAWFAKGSDPELIYRSIGALLERQLAAQPVAH